MTTATELKRDYSRREQFAWCLYEAAPAVFNTSGILLYLPFYIGLLTSAAADASHQVYLFGIPMKDESVWDYAVGLSVLLQALVLPLAGAFADLTRRKREALGATAAIGGLAAIVLFFPTGSNWVLACALFLLANVALGAASVIYNSFLPEIAPPAERDSLSSKSWATGYVAGCFMLVVHSAFLMYAGRLGISSVMALRIAIASSGVWWLLWTIPPFRRVRNRGEIQSLRGKSIVRAGFGQIRHTFSHMSRYPQTLRFLIAYLLYNDAIQTVFVVATQFGKNVIHLDATQLTITVFIAQLVGIGGALALDQLAARITPKRAVAVTLIVWILLIVYAAFYVHSALEFYVMAGFAGLVMGGSQALSRSIFAQLIPHKMEAEYFSIYAIADKGTSFMGPLTVGVVLQHTGGDYTPALLSLLVFLVAGLGVLTTADVKQGAWDVLKSA